MVGSRLANANSFECTELVGMTVDIFFGYYEEGDPISINMIIIKLTEKSLYQRFFLDTGVGFWEEWNEGSAMEDFEGEPQIDLAEMYHLKGASVSEIVCKGCDEEFSSIYFKIGSVELEYHCKDRSDCESSFILTRL